VNVVFGERKWGEKLLNLVVGGKNREQQEAKLEGKSGVGEGLWSQGQQTLRAREPQKRK